MLSCMISGPLQPVGKRVFRTGWCPIRSIVRTRTPVAAATGVRVIVTPPGRRGSSPYRICPEMPEHRRVCTFVNINACFVQSYAHGSCVPDSCAGGVPAYRSEKMILPAGLKTCNGSGPDVTRFFGVRKKSGEQMFGSPVSADFAASRPQAEFSEKRVTNRVSRNFC